MSDACPGTNASFGLRKFRMSELQTYPVALGFLLAMNAEDGDELLWEMYLIKENSNSIHPYIAGEVTEEPLRALVAHYFVLHGYWPDIETIPF